MSINLYKKNLNKNHDKISKYLKILVIISAVVFAVVLLYDVFVEGNFFLILISVIISTVVIIVLSLYAYSFIKLLSKIFIWIYSVFLSLTCFRCAGEGSISYDTYHQDGVKGRSSSGEYLFDSYKKSHSNTCNACNGSGRKKIYKLIIGYLFVIFVIWFSYNFFTHKNLDFLPFIN